MNRHLRLATILILTLLATSYAAAGEPYLCSVSHLNPTTRAFEKQETELVTDTYDAVLETDAGDVKLRIWRSWSKMLGTGIITSKKIHMNFSVNGKKSVEKSAREGDVLTTQLKKEWRIRCAPLFPIFPGRVSPEQQKHYDEKMN